VSYMTPQWRRAIRHRNNNPISPTGIHTKHKEMYVLQ
jgi:hypothetical protein